MKKKKKRHTQLPPEEQAVHREATRIRSMEDKLLVETFHRAAEPETALSAVQVAQSGLEALGPTTETSGVKRLLSALSEGRVKGIKSATAYKVAQLAAEMGLV